MDRVLYISYLQQYDKIIHIKSFNFMTFVKCDFWITK